MGKRKLRLPNSLNLAIHRLQVIQKEAQERNREHKKKAEQVKRAIQTLQTNVRYKSWIKKADAVVDVDDYIGLMLTLPPFESAPETKVVLLKKKKYVSEFSIYGNRGSFYELVKQFHDGPTGEDNFIPNILGADQILLFKPKKIEGVNLKQIFRDNHQSNCVFIPIRNTINEILTGEMSINTRQKYQQMLDRLSQEEVSFPNGVPHDEIIPLSKRLGFRIELTDIIGQTFLENGAKNTKAKIKLTNTRMNHVDNYTDESAQEITDEEMTALYKSLRSSNEFYLIYNDTDRIRTIKTLNGTFTIKDADQSLIDQMNQQVKSAGIDAIKYPELNDFLKEGRVINSYVVKFREFNNQVKCWDMKKAYSQYNTAPNYEGFPYLIHQFRPISKIINTGIYEFVINKSTELSRLFGLIADQTYILPSPEIKWWITNGVEVEIIKGAFGSTLDITMTQEFINKKLYNKWIGKLSASDNFRHTKHTFPADLQFVQHIASVYPKTYYTGFRKEAQVQIPNKHVSTKHHIGAFFTSYTRLHMLNVLQHIPINEIYGVELDSIFTTATITNPLFREKERIFTDQTFYAEKWYSKTIKTYNPIKPLHELITTNTLLSGQGGSGKTYSILEDKGYIEPLYIVPNHELGKNSNRNYRTIHKLIGLGTAPLYTEYIPSVLLLDEITQYHEDMIYETFRQYPHSLILLAGDIDSNQHYQCRGGYTNNYMPIYKPDIPIVNYTNDFRSKTETLKQMKLDLRSFMKQIYTDGGTSDTHKIRTYLKRNYKHISINEAKELATEDDIFLWGTHKSQKRLDGFNSKGVHEFQGQTINQPTKIFIINDWFEYAMPYTAISRATDHNQIIFVSTQG